MAENVESLILEQIKILRNEIKTQGVKMDEQFESVRLRLGSIEGGLAGLHTDVAIVHGRLDKLESRLDRIEHRLELRDESL